MGSTVCAAVANHEDWECTTHCIMVCFHLPSGADGSTYHSGSCTSHVWGDAFWDWMVGYLSAVILTFWNAIYRVVGIGALTWHCWALVWQWSLQHSNTCAKFIGCILLLHTPNPYWIFPLQYKWRWSVLDSEQALLKQVSDKFTALNDLFRT